MNPGSFVALFEGALIWWIGALALIAWYTIRTKRKEEKVETLSHSELKKSENADEDDEYHNDFSKVPAGTEDNAPRMPRSIGYGFGDGGRGFEEDLQKLNDQIIEDKKAEDLEKE